MPGEASNQGDDTASTTLNHPTSITGVVKLEKNLGLLNGVAIIVGVIIGSGIFVSPKGVLQEVGSVYGSLLIWVLCGLIALIGAMCYAELGTSIMKSGAGYAYINEAYGGLPAFLFVWVNAIVIIPTTNAISGLAFANYLLQPLFPYCDVPNSAKRLFAAFAICILTFINCRSVKLAAKIQNVFTIAKVLALFIVIVIGLVQVIRLKGDIDSLRNGFEGTTRDPSGIALAFYSGLFSYAGWNYLNFVVEELKDPYKDLPRAIWISIPLVTFIYVFANIAYFTVLTPQELLQSNAVAVSFADRTMGYLAWSMPLFVAASTFGGLNGNLFSASRLFFVAARSGHLPHAIALVNVKYLTPISSLLFMGLLSLIMLCSSDLYSLINYSTFVEATFIGLSVSGLLYLRWKRPHMKRPIKVSLVFPLFYLVITLFLLITPLFNNPFECMMGIFVTLSGVPVYIVCVMWKNKPMSFNNLVDKTYVLIQKILYAVPQDKED